MQVQTVAARTVGEIAAEIAAAAPGEQTVNLAGPGRGDMVDLARKVIRRWGRHTRVIPMPVPGQLGRSMRAGDLTPGPGARVAGPSFDEWLAGDDVMALAPGG
jgi:uncharacterized protein YbjT (DUF2867 family)